MRAFHLLSSIPYPQAPMILVNAVILIALMGVCSFGTGFYIVRRLKWGTDEILCGAIGLSLILIYAAGTAIYLMDITWKVCWLISAAALVLTVISWRDLRCFLARRHVQLQLRAFGFLLMVGVLLLSAIRHYSGGDWVADWIGHYQRAMYFLREQPYDPNLFVPDPLPTRPPMMNILAAYFLAHEGIGFDLFQLVFLFLNLLVLFPCVLLAGLLVKFGSRHVGFIASFLTLSPVFLENATYAWTKLLTAFFVLLSLALYLRGWRKNEPTRIIASAIAMAAAVLVHYSAGPYALAMALHYCLILPSRRNWLKEVLGALAASGALLATWFAWSLIIFGSELTFKSNTSVADASQLTVGQNAVKIGQNLLHTLVPHPLLGAWGDFRADFYQPDALGRVRDYFFLIYQTTLGGAWGVLGWCAVLWLGWRQMAISQRPLRRFWALLILIGVILGVAVHGAPARYGVAHVCLQPLILIGAVLVAAGFGSLPRWARGILLVSLAFDALMGIALQYRAQSVHLPWVQTPGWPMMQLSDTLLSLPAIQNAALEQQLHLTTWGGHFAAINSILYLAVMGLLSLALLRIGRGSVPGAVVAAASILFLIASWVIPGNLTFAVTSLRPQAEAIDPAAARYATGLAHYELGEIDLASAELIDAFVLDPNDLRARYVLQVLLVTHGRLLTQTDAASAEMVRIDPTNPVARQSLAAALRGRGLDKASKEPIKQQ